MPEGKVVAVIGDGALTGGVAFEALHNAGGMDMPIVIVINDNGMSIAPNVGALSRYFNRVRLNPGLYRAREEIEETLTRLPAGIGERIERIGPQLKESIRSLWAPGLFFEELDLAYVGVIDGHDVAAVREALRAALAARRPVVVHVRTVKGKGFAAAEDGGLAGMEAWHAAKPASIVGRRPAVPQVSSAATRPPPYTAVFGRALLEECRADERVCAITAAMNSGTGLDVLQKAMPDRYYDVGIAEQHAVLFAAGLALGGMKPVVAIYSTFLQRGLRPDRPRRLPAEAQRRVRDRPGGARRRRRPDPPRSLRHLLPALPAEHRAHGPARRDDARRHAAHGARLRRRSDRAALPARHRRGLAARARAGHDPDRARRDPADRRAGGAAGLRLGRRARARARPSGCWGATGCRSPSPTRASPSRWTPS